MNNSTLTCPGCEKGTLTEDIYSDEFKHGDATVIVHGLEGYVCDTCDAEPIYPEQSYRGHIQITDAKRRHDGLLTTAEIISIRKALGLTQAQASEVFGGDDDAFSKYESGAIIQSVATDKLLRMARDYPQVGARLLGETSTRAHGVA